MKYKSRQLGNWKEFRNNLFIVRHHSLHLPQSLIDPCRLSFDSNYFSSSYYRHLLKQNATDHPIPNLQLWDIQNPNY